MFYEKYEKSRLIDHKRENEWKNICLGYEHA